MNCGCKPAHASRQSYVTDTGDVTFAAAVAGKRAVVDRIIVTATSAQPFILTTGATARLTANCPANDTQDLPDLNIRGGMGEAAIITMPAAGSPAALVYYHYETVMN